MLAPGIALSTSAITTLSPADTPLTIWISVSPRAPVTTRFVDRMPFVTTWTVPDPVPVGVTAEAGRTTAASTVFVVIVAATREVSGSASPPVAIVITVAYVVVDWLLELLAPVAAAAAAKLLVVVGSRAILEIVPWSVVPPIVLVTVAA